MKRVQHARSHSLQGRKHPLARVCNGLERRHSGGIELFLELINRQGTGDIPLVVLNDQRHVLDRASILREVLCEVTERLQVFLHHVWRGVRHEDQAVDPLQNQLAGRAVVDLARHRIDLKASAHPSDRPQIERHEVEEQGSISLGTDTRQLTAIALGSSLVNDLEVRRLPRHTRPVVDDFCIDLLLCEVI